MKIGYLRKCTAYKIFMTFNYCLNREVAARRQMMSLSSVKMLCITGRRHPPKYMPCRSETSVTVVAQPAVNPFTFFFFYYHAHWLVKGLDSLTQ